MGRAELMAVLRGTGCAVARGRGVFLCDPAWPHSERVAAERQMALAGAADAREPGGWLCVRTGGSGGVVKFARHDEMTLGAAVRGFCAHFGVSRVNAIDVLPAYHVSGLMARMRCADTGGRHLAWSWKQMEAGELPPVSGDDWVLSLVPTQLQRLLKSPDAVEWLRRFRLIFLGGGPVWPQLADDARAARMRVSLTYGMTETAAMIAALRPEEFLGGELSSGSVMPHACVTLDAAGRLTVSGESLFRGYWPDWQNSRVYETEDLARVDERGHLHLLGRRDAMIITGGRKVNPNEVEAALRASGEFEDVAVIGLPDAEWGEVVVACYPHAAAREPDFARGVGQLAPFQRPKRFVAIAEWPRNAQGKVNREVLRQTVAATVVRTG
jgi:O-succinylbenzoic acid--CoA ligase